MGFRFRRNADFMRSIRKELHRWRNFLLAKQVVAFLQIGPQAYLILIFAVSGDQPGERFVVESGRIDGDIYFPLTGIVGIDAINKQLFHSVIVDGNASRRFSAAVNVNQVAQPSLNTPYAVGGIGIVNFHRQVIFAVWIQFVDVIKTFRNLQILRASLGANFS